MKSPLNPTGTGNAVLRPVLLVLPAILAGGIAIGCGPQGMPAPQTGTGPQALPGQPQPLLPQSTQSTQSSLVGQWLTTLQSGPLTLTIEANGQYMQVGQATAGQHTQMAQGGPYQLIAPNTIVFTVTDWSPKTKVMFVPEPGPVPSVPNPVGPYPGPNGPQYQEYAIPHPPGSRYAYTFNGPNTMILSNEQAQETITFTRGTGQ
jgi:hypothetical protein